MSLQKSNTKESSRELAETKSNTRVTFDKPEKEINKLHEEIKEAVIDAANTYVRKAIQIGEKLFQVKENSEHGKFKEWVKENLKFSYMNATRYMKIYTHKEAIQEMGYTSIRQALQFLEVTSKQNERKIENQKELMKKFRLALKTKDNSILGKREKLSLVGELEQKEESVSTQIDRLKKVLVETKKRKDFLLLDEK